MHADSINPDIDRDITLVSETASDNAVHYLRSLIFMGELGAGDRLPPERELAERLGISRITLRLALKSLESTGYIVTTRGARGGSRVNDPPFLLRCWNQWMSLHSDELEDIFELRLTIEMRLAALAAERRTEEELRAIETAYANEWDNPNRTKLFRGDVDIHKTIARAAHSPRLERAMIAARGELFVPVDQAITEHREHEAHESHGAILEAIRGKDAARAAECMSEHIKYVRIMVQRALESSAIMPSAPR
ncbi:MAG TPA: FCD domain-containing protein [Thermoleophilia bacterium]